MQRFPAIEIKTPLLVDIARAISPWLQEKNVEEIKGNWLVFDYPVPGEFRFVRTADFYDDFTEIEVTGTNITVATFIKD